MSFQLRCKGKAQTPKPYTEGCRVILTGTHNHTEDPARQELEDVQRRVRERAREGLLPRRIISEEAVGLSQEARGRLQVDNLKRNIRRQRERDGGLPPNPAPGARVPIPPRFRVTKNGSRFLLFDTYDNEEEDEEEEEDGDHEPRIIMFASHDQLRILGSTTSIHYDGTFKVAPQQFHQLFVIHAIKQGVTYPAVFCLMENRTQETYTKIFQEVKRALPGWEPENAMGDFELASSRALSAAFPRIQITGCLFHLSQSVFRKAVDLGLRVRYINDENIRAHVRFLPALAFVPTADVREAFHAIQETDTFPEHDGIQELYDYFETTYIGREGRGGRVREPRHKPQTWNQRERTLQGLGRTNNIIEGWHRGIQSSLDGDNPTLWKCLAFLQLEEDWCRTTEQRVLGGQDVKLEKADQKRRTRRLQDIIPAYGERPIQDYLRGVSYNIAMPV